MALLPVKSSRLNRRVILRIVEGTGATAVLKKTVYGFDDSGSPYGLRVSFSVERKIASVADSAVVRIWNLNEESRSMIAQRSLYYDRRDPLRYLQIGAGHRGTSAITDTTSVIFNGAIVIAFNERQGPDWVTEIQASAVHGQALLNQINKPWRTTPLANIIRELFGVAGWANVNISPQAAIVIASKVETSLAVSGSAYQAATTVLKNHGLTFNVDHDGVTVFVSGYPRDPLPLPVNEDTGLIGTPKVTALGADFKTLLDPRIRPGQLVTLKSETLGSSIAANLGSEYVIWGAKALGDTHTDDWSSEAEGRITPPPSDAASSVAGPVPIGVV